MNKRILLTAFEPFGGDTINPALKIAGILAEKYPDLDICAVPVTFRDSGPTVLMQLGRASYDAVVMLGQAKCRKAVTVERVAINIDDASMPDNAGDQPVDRPIDPNGPAAIFATLPVKAAVEAMRAAGVEAAVSNSAGTYVCNHLMYCVLNHLSRSGVPAGFIHVPALPEQVKGSDVPSMALEDMVCGVEAVLGIL